MWNPVESWRQQRARTRYMRHARPERTGRTAKVALAALAVILLANALLELRDEDHGEALAGYVAREGVPPLDLVEQAGRSRRLVFLADIPGSSATKRFAVEAIARLAGSSGLDVVALPIDAGEQRYIDLYLNTESEDAALLVARPRLLHEHEGADRDYLALFRQVRALNERLGADRQIRVVALDPPGWPPERAVAPHELARRFGERAEHMSETIGTLLAREPRARVLFLVDGLHVLHGVRGTVQTGGTRSVAVPWLAAQLKQQYPQDVFSILVDAATARAVAPHVVTYRGTAAGPLLADARGGTPVAVPLGSAFGFTRQPLRLGARPGIRFDMDPHGFTLPQVADAYIYLGD